MSTSEKRQQQSVVGQPLDRVDGRLKVTGRARYPAEVPLANLAHAVLVQSTIASGRIREMDTRPAEAAPGVHAVLTHRNAPRLQAGPPNFLGPAAPPPLQDDRISYNGQHVAVVVAETLEQATFAATLVTITYAEEIPLLQLDEKLAQPFASSSIPDVVRGEPDAALAAAAVRVEGTYTTPTEHHNPLAPCATIAVWDGDQLILYDTTQWIDNVRTVMAAMFGLPDAQVRVIAPFVGGAFGSTLRCWPHVALAAMAARQSGRPVKLVLTRAQMYTSVGYRPQTIQHVALGATRDGQLVATVHEGREPTAMHDDYREGLVRATQSLYACPHLRTSFRQVRLNVGTPTWMRAPGEGQGIFALETAMDELAYALDLDPVELRLRNDATVHPQSGRPWSSRGLRECYALGAERFGWEHRTRAPRSMRDGQYLVGWGVASALYPYVRIQAAARARLLADGSAIVQSSATDIGVGTYTVMTQIAAERLGLSPEHVRCELGDSSFPASSPQGGSTLTASVGSAVYMAASAVLEQVLALVRDDDASPLRGASADVVVVRNGHIALKSDPSQGETYAAILQRHGLREIEAWGRAAPGDEMQRYGTGIFGARFAEVRVDPELGLIRVTRLVSATAAGRILNEKTARSQIVGGTVGGIGMALLEHTVMDANVGRIVNANMAEYLVPVHADIPAIDVLFVDEPDFSLNPIGVKGLGEIGLVGVAPAIANAVYHATGQRIRDLPITLDKLQ